MNAKVIEALKGISDNLNIIVEEMEKSSEKSVATSVAKEISVPAVKEKKSNVVPMSRKAKEESEELPDVNGNLTQEQLDGLSYNNLKKLAKEMGIPATGAREELTQKILNTDVSATVEDTEKAEDKPVKKSPRKLGKKSEPEPEEEEESEEEEVDPIVDKVNEAVSDMTDEEILDTLADVGVKARGKRQALIAAVIKAVKDGKIDLDDDGEEESEDVEETPVSDDTEDEVDVNDLSNEDMTKERCAAIEAFDSETRSDFEEGTITRKDLVEWLNEFNQTKDTMKKKSDEELVDEYIYCSCLLINDEGEMPEEEGAYTVNGSPYCCGHELKFNEDNNTYICEICGGEYEAE